MYKMVIIDLDGTLLNDQKEVSKKDAYVINKAYKEKKTICVIGTGRSYMCANYIASIVGEGLSQYIIASTGSEILDVKNERYLNKQCISNKNTIKILEYVKKYNLRCSANISSKVVSNSRLVNQEILDKIGEKYEIIENLLEYFTTNNVECISLSVIGNEENLLKIKKELTTIEEIETTELCKTIDMKENEKEIVTYIDIITKGATKKNAIKILADYLKIKKDEIIVIGDGGNDLPMFETAGLKVAMSNSLDIVKEKADYVTGSNNESGVAKAIMKFVRGKKKNLRIKLELFPTEPNFQNYHKDFHDRTIITNNVWIGSEAGFDLLVQDYSTNTNTRAIKTTKTHGLYFGFGDEAADWLNAAYDHLIEEAKQCLKKYGYETNNRLLQ